jgi:ubiquinone/menaquinone biosynthesis C-methylase UbiE
MDYVRTIYSKENKPITGYPQKLISYLYNLFNMAENKKLLEVGCGRGDFLNAFSKMKLRTYGVDISDFAKEFCHNSEIKTANLENERLPYGDNTFDYVYSKSLIEHFYYPEKIYREIFRVLKPGGVVITLTPHWKYIYKSFYEDYSHRTPFTIESIIDLQKIRLI